MEGIAVLLPDAVGPCISTTPTTDYRLAVAVGAVRTLRTGIAEEKYSDPAYKMLIERVQVRNFRCLRNVEFDLARLIALVGENGTGKSALLSALQFFFAEPGSDPDDDDCWSQDPNLTIEVTLTFGGLPSKLKEHLELHLDDRGGLLLARRSEPASEGPRPTTYVSRRRISPAFLEIRAETNKREARKKYAELAMKDEFQDLPAVSNYDEMVTALLDYEREHAAQLEWAEDRSVGIGSGYATDVGPWFVVVTVPAVRDAAQEAAESQGGSLRGLVERLVYPEVPFRERLGVLEANVHEKYLALVEEGKGALARAEEALSARVDLYAPGSGVKLDWDPKPPSVSAPTVSARLVEGGVIAQVGRQGHGVQRAYLLALLQELATRVSKDAASGDSSPLLILLIEEPELYQHPTRARLFSRVLDGLARSSEDVQVVITTHSPYFVSLDRVDGIRILRRGVIHEPTEARASSVNLATAARELWEASGRGDPEFTADSLRTHLRLLMDTPLSEGFFARAAVVVEGDADRAMLAAAASAVGVDLHQHGIAVVAARGKGYLDKPLVVFRGIGIPTYLIFDGDADKGEQDREPATNLRLLNLLGEPAQEQPPTTVRERWACFESNMVAWTRREVGAEIFDEMRAEVCEELHVTGRRRQKDPIVLGATVQRLFERGTPPASLTDILNRVLALA